MIKVRHLIVLLFLVCGIFAGPADPDLTRVPQPYLQEHPGWVDLYKRAYEISFTKIQQGTPENGFVPYYMDEGFNANIFQWDTGFMMMFGRYSNGELPSIVSLENFYGKQDGTGWICREFRELDGSPYWPSSGSQDANCSINPPLFSWAEWSDYEISGDLERFTKTVNGKPIIQILIDYYDWIKNNRRWDNDLYWATSFAGGMDRSPRLDMTSPDQVCNNAGGSWIDISAQQALNAYYIAKIAGVLGMEQEEQRFLQEYEGIKDLVNANFWDEQDGFYYDIDNGGNFYKAKTAASFWVMISRIATQERVGRMVEEHILNPSRFWTEHHIPSVAKDDAGYKSDGGYWEGAVWAPTTYETIKGLEISGYPDVARRIAVNHIQHIYWVYRSTNTLHENYHQESTHEGYQSRPDFVGWTGVGPIACLIENVMGIKTTAYADSLHWTLYLAEEHGINNFKFGDNTVDLLVQDRLTPEDGAAVTVTTDSPFKLCVKIGSAKFDRDVPIGTTSYEFGTVQEGISSIDVTHKGVSANGFGAAGDEVQRYQTFTAGAVPVLAGVDIKVQRINGESQSDITVDLYNAQDGKPDGESIASAVIDSNKMDSFFSIVHAELFCDQLVGGNEYAVVLSQKNTQSTCYEWVNGMDVSPDIHFGKGDGAGNWTDESQLGDGWLKVYLIDPDKVKAGRYKAWAVINGNGVMSGPQFIQRITFGDKNRIVRAPRHAGSFDVYNTCGRLLSRGNAVVKGKGVIPPSVSQGMLVLRFE